ncbi:MAG: hypothetical protein LBN95_01220, partial [Prevotellaceae bacterium]|nr:hypothetical protein [Prevotellaceae bacterium]
MKKTFLLLLCLLSFAGYAQINVKDSIQTILSNDTLAPKIRYTNAHRFVRVYSSPEEAEQLGLEVIYPFVQKTWKDKANRLGYLARIQSLVGECYRERGGDDRNEKERFYFEKAIQTAIESGNDTVCAYLYGGGGFVEIHRGSTNKAHEYLYQAVKYYNKMENYVKSSEMLYVIASTFYEIKDTDGLYRVLQQMEECLKKDVSKQSLYQYNVIKHSYYDLLLAKEKKEKGTVDACL